MGVLYINIEKYPQYELYKFTKQLYENKEEKEDAILPGVEEKTQVEDTTGAGDGFIGSFLYQLDKNSVDVDKLKLLNKEDLERYLDFSNRYCAISVTKKGAMDSYPTLDEFLEII